MRRIIDVSLICTVFNEESSIASFLDSLFVMNTLPAEIIIVDGGSTDRTREVIGVNRRDDIDGVTLRVFEDLTCNIRYTPGPIARGRNRAIREATYEIIACTDLGCRFDGDWLEKVTAPLFANDQVSAVGGWYRPDTSTVFESLVARVFLAERPARGSGSGFIPSSRSFAFRKSVWEAVGGYPEDFYWGEDTRFVLMVLERGYVLECEPAAFVHWKIRSSLRSFLTMIYRYGQGDGFYGHFPSNVSRNGAKVVLFLVIITSAGLLSPYLLFLLIPFWSFLLFRKRRITLAIVYDILWFPILGALKTLQDMAYLLGYLRGVFLSRVKSSEATTLGHFSL